MDIAILLESHRKHMLDSFDSRTYEVDDPVLDQIVAIAHDRATTRTLLDLYRSGQAGNGLPSTTQPSTASNTITIPSRRVKAGSKKARERALKAGETRRKNLAARAGEGNLAPVDGSVSSSTGEGAA